MKRIPTYLRDNIVKADSVEDFLKRYYKPERYTGRGNAYAKILLCSYNKDHEDKGYCFISAHDSVTGQIVVFWEEKTY